MKVIECHFEFGGFDDHLVKGGISIYLWNLCQALRKAGHEVSALTAAHGLVGRLRREHPVEDLRWRLDTEIPVRLDPRVWPSFPGQVSLPVQARAHRLHIAGMEVIFLSGGLLDTCPESFYPPYESKGRDLTFLKPLVFQAAATRFLADTAEPGTVLHLHEPFYHYLMPAALRPRGLVPVSTVQSNMPVNKKAYGPEVRELLAWLGADTAVAEGLADPPLEGPLHEAMRAYLPGTLLYNDYPERPGHDYVSILALVARSAAALDFLSPGQLEHVVTQADTPFEQLFTELAVHRELRACPEKLVVGGCAIGDWWLEETPGRRRQETLLGLGLDPALPTVYHNARYAVQHKGQREMFRALRRLLDEGERCNVLMHCLSPTPVDDAELAALAARHPSLVRARTDPMDQQELLDWASASDLCLYPSKFEMDTFLLAMGEAMALGAVPIATAQRGMEHFGHSFDLADPAATGLAVPRSFQCDDALLVQNVYDGLRRMLCLVNDDPARLEALRSRAVRVVRKFTWERAAGRFDGIFTACAAGTLPPPPPAALLARGWSGQLGAEQLGKLGSDGLEAAERTGDAELWRRLQPGRTPPWPVLFDAACARVDLARCRQIAEHSGMPSLKARLRERGTARRDGDSLEVRWAFAPAARVDVVIPVTAATASVVALTPDPDGSFHGRVPAGRTDSVALLVTLPAGRTSWDCLPVTVEE